MSKDIDISPEQVLKKLPKQTPAWAVGIVAIVVSLITSFSAFYLISRADISQYVLWQEQHQDQEDINLETRYTTTLNAILSLVDSNAKQLTEVSKSLGIAQQQNSALSERVSQLEKNLSIVSASLQTCESKLSICKGK